MQDHENAKVVLLERTAALAKRAVPMRRVARCWATSGMPSVLIALATEIATTAVTSPSA